MFIRGEEFVILKKVGFYLMKQVLQGLANGTSNIADVPRPRCKSGHLLIQSLNSLISAGTERMLVDFGRASYLEKARQQPEKVKMVLNKVKTDGLKTTFDAVKSKLDQPMPMGYSNVGVVIEVGSGVEGFKIGDRVVSNGAHAEMVCVPKHLCAKVPTDVSDEDAAFTVVGSIALQGVRLTQPTIGECFVVTGLGLIGLMTVQILRANGCRVLGLDFDASKLKLAEAYGAETVNLGEGQDPIAAAEEFSRGRGVDGVIITASTKSNEPVHQAAEMCRQRGRIVLVGVVGLELQRADFYEKELTFQVSSAYGPGRYDPFYEDQGHDYPIGFVRWTSQRNFEAVLDMISKGSIETKALKSGYFAIDEAPKAYDMLLEDKSALGVFITYNSSKKDLQKRTLEIKGKKESYKPEAPVIGAIGAGNYAGRMLLPAIKKTGARLKTIASSQGVSSAHYGKKFNFELNTTDSDTIFNDEEINTVVVTTQHNTHAGFVVQALKTGKNVFVEKPLAITNTDLDKIEKAYRKSHSKGAGPALMVGFNRRFAPLIKPLKKQISKSSEVVSLIYTCNAGHIPAEAWYQDAVVGGGRIIGEACHFIDMARYLIASPIKSVVANGIQTPEGVGNCHDTATITLTFENGSIATIHYFANGHQSFPKERIEVFQAGKVFVLDNFRKTKGYGSAIKKSSFSQNKGQEACFQTFIDGLVSGEGAPISFEEIMEVSRVSVDAWNQLIKE